MYIVSFNGINILNRIKLYKRILANQTKIVITVFKRLFKTDRPTHGRDSRLGAFIFSRESIQ